MNMSKADKVATAWRAFWFNRIAAYWTLGTVDASAYWRL